MPRSHGIKSACETKTSVAICIKVRKKIHAMSGNGRGARHRPRRAPELRVSKVTSRSGGDAIGPARLCGGSNRVVPVREITDFSGPERRLRVRLKELAYTLAYRGARMGLQAAPILGMLVPPFPPKTKKPQVNRLGLFSLCPADLGSHKGPCLASAAAAFRRL